MSPCGICSPTIELGAGWWYYRFQFGHDTPLYLSICVSICIHAHAGPHNTVTSLERHGVSNHRWLKSLSKRNQPVTGGFPTQRGGVAEIWFQPEQTADQTQERSNTRAAGELTYSFRWISVRLQYLQCVSRYRYSLWFILSPDSSCPPFPQI